MDSPSYRIELPFLAEADAEAARLGSEFIAPEHLLLAVAANPSGASKTFLDRRDLTSDSLRQTVADIDGEPSGERETHRPRTVALRALRALAHAIEAAAHRSARGLRFSPNELLGALLADDVARGAVIEAVLERLGITVTAAQAEFADLRAVEETGEEVVAGITIGDLQREIDRVKVDMRRARTRLREIDPTLVKPISQSEHEEVHTIDLLLLMETLRALPDGAGTSAFLTAYAERRQGRA